MSGAGFRNKGAEAMTLTLCRQLGQRVPDLEVLAWDCLEPQKDLAISAGLVPLSRPAPGGQVQNAAWVLARILARGGLKFSHIRHPLTVWPDFSAVPMLESAGDFDALFDISGFAYGDIWGPGPALSTVPACREARKRSLPVVFMPQAWGALDRPSVRDAVLSLTRGPRTLVFSRDARSTSYLLEAGVSADSIATRSDIVFAFEGASEVRGRALLQSMGCDLDRPVVGVTPNMRAYDRSAGIGADNAYVRSLVALVRHCVDRHGADVVLLPSECAPVDRGTDDRKLCAIVRGEAQRDTRCHTDTAYVAAEDVWAMVGRCEYVIGSRFHSLVFALSQGVPCTVLGWSHKYAELMAQFDAGDSCVDHENVSEQDAIDLFEVGWAHRAASREKNLRVASRLRADVYELFDEVAEFLARAGR